MNRQKVNWSVDKAVECVNIYKKTIFEKYLLLYIDAAGWKYGKQHRLDTCLVHTVNYKCWGNYDLIKGILSLRRTYFSKRNQ